MTPAFGTVPPEPKRITALDVCAPKFAAAVMAVLHDLQEAGFDPIVYESLRIDERQSWLDGFGRAYDDGRGIVTNAQSTLYSWHGFGLAVDIVSEAHGWDSSKFFDALGGFATVQSLEWGGHWKVRDLPHVQWGGMRESPSDLARQLYADAGMRAVWREVGAA